MSHFYLPNIWTFLYFQNRFIVFQLELLTWLLIHFWCNKSRLWFRFNIEHVSFGFLIYYYTINLSSWTITLHSLEMSQYCLSSWCSCPCRKFQNIWWISSEKISLNFHWKWDVSSVKVFWKTFTVNRS